MQPLSSLIHLKQTTKTSHYNILDVILSLSLQSTNLEGERGKGKEKFFYFSIISVML